MDLDLPGCTGVEACSRIGELVPAARVLILTGSTDESDEQKAGQAGAAGYLRKTGKPRTHHRSGPRRGHAPSLAVAVVVLLLTLGACWLQPTTSNRAALLSPGIFAVGLLASIIHLRSLPEAAIPLAGFGALLVSVVGLATTGLRLRNH